MHSNESTDQLSCRLWCKNIHFYNFLVRQLARFELNTETLSLHELKEKIKRPFHYHIIRLHIASLSEHSHWGQEWHFSE